MQEYYFECIYVNGDIKVITESGNSVTDAWSKLWPKLFSSSKNLSCVSIIR